MKFNANFEIDDQNIERCSVVALGDALLVPFYYLSESQTLVFMKFNATLRSIIETSGVVPSLL